MGGWDVPVLALPEGTLGVWEGGANVAVGVDLRACVCLSVWVGG